MYATMPVPWIVLGIFDETTMLLQSSAGSRQKQVASFMSSQHGFVIPLQVISPGDSIE